MAAEEEPRARLDFKSPEELRLACRALAGRLHYINRVAGGESVFYIEVAKLLEDLGRTFETYHDDKAVRAAFGDGWTAGEIPREDRRAALVKLIEGRD